MGLEYQKKLKALMQEMQLQDIAPLDLKPL
jgi:hypothetical protein